MLDKYLETLSHVLDEARKDAEAMLDDERTGTHPSQETTARMEESIYRAHCLSKDVLAVVRGFYGDESEEWPYGP